MRVTTLSTVIATYKGRAFGHRASDPKADFSCAQNFVAEAATKCQNCKAVKWPKQPPLTQSRSSHAYTNGSQIASSSSSSSCAPCSLSFLLWHRRWLWFCFARTLALRLCFCFSFALRRRFWLGLGLSLWRRPRRCCCLDPRSFTVGGAEKRGG